MEKKLDLKSNIFTIPNLLSALRVLLIPVIVWLYCFRHADLWAVAVLILSGVTDIADGFIARKFHMTSDLGKIIDPVADKLTQGVTLICLGTRFAPMMVLAAVLIVKEVCTGLHSLNVVRKTQTVKSSDWHGKLVTVLLYITMTIHIFWAGIPSWLSIALTALCLVPMAVSFTLYLRRNARQMAEGRCR